MTDRQQAEGLQMVDLIQGYLEHRNWEPVSGAGWRWVEHTFDNGHGTLGLHFSPSSPGHLHFTYEDDRSRARLDISFANSPVELLDAISEYRAILAEETWPSFIGTLLRHSPAVVAIAEEVDEQDAAIRTVQDGVQALKEIDWEYVDEENDQATGGDTLGPCG